MGILACVREQFLKLFFVSTECNQPLDCIVEIHCDDDTETGIKQEIYAHLKVTLDNPGNKKPQSF